MLEHVVFWVELPVQRRLCPIFVSGVGLPDYPQVIPRVDGLSTDPWEMGRHSFCVAIGLGDGPGLGRNKGLRVSYKAFLRWDIFVATEDFMARQSFPRVVLRQGVFCRDPQFKPARDRVLGKRTTGLSTGMSSRATECTAHAR